MFITQNHNLYPDKFKKDTPEKFFFYGNLNKNSLKTMATIGSRKMSDYGKKQPKRL